MLKKDITKNRNTAVFAVILLAVFVLGGCGRLTDSGETQPVTFQIDDPEPGSTAADTNTKQDKAELLNIRSFEESLQVIALLNGCKTGELNAVYDSEGYLSFLGNRFTIRKVQSAEAAMQCLEDLNLICGLDGLQFQFSRKDTSPVSGNTYYTIKQVAGSDYQEQPISFFDNQIRIFTDGEGNAVGFSCDVNRTPVDSIREDEIIGRGDAECFVQEKLSSGSRILSEYSELVFWKDSNNVSENDSEAVFPVWRIYSNEPRGGKAYSVYLVYAYPLEIGSEIYTLIGIQPVQSPEAESSTDNYTSEIFFAGMQPAGEFTYQLNMSWAKNAGTGYEAQDTVTVSVPVMYDPVNRIYYLADFDERIAVSNYYDFNRNNTPNPVVTTNPYDLNSWHFKNTTIPGDSKAYYFDPNYILASYSTMRSVYLAYKERYGFDSVDTTGLPILLNVYYYSGSYPDSPDGFYPDSFNCGEQHDWEVFATSPAASASADFGKLSREFAHGIHSRFSCAQVLNGQGAVSEGYADTVGELMAYLCGAKYERFKWLVGSQITAPVGSFFNPYEYRQAKYIGGAYYVSPVSDRFSAYTESGGVRTNCGAVDQLAFCMNKSSDKDAPVLTLEQNLDLWFETVYCMNYKSSYRELGAYLCYASGCIGSLTQEQITYVKETVDLLGFGDSDGQLQALIEKENNQKISLTFLSDDAEDIRVSAALDNGQNMGMTDDDGKLTYLCPEVNGRIILQVLWKGAMVGKADLGQAEGSSVFIIESHILTGQTGTEFDCGKETILSCSIMQNKELLPDEEGNVIRKDAEGKNSVLLQEKGVYCILTKNNVLNNYQLYVVRTLEQAAAE